MDFQISESKLNKILENFPEELSRGELVLIFVNICQTYKIPFPISILIFSKALEILKEHQGLENELDNFTPRH